MTKATFEHPAFPKGELFFIDGVGEVENGSEFEVPEGADLDALDNNAHISIAGRKKKVEEKAEEGGEES